MKTIRELLFGNHSLQLAQKIQSLREQHEKLAQTLLDRAESAEAQISGVRASLQRGAARHADQIREGRAENERLRAELRAEKDSSIIEADRLADCRRQVEMLEAELEKLRPAGTPGEKEGPDA